MHLLGCVVKSGEMEEVWQLSFVFHRIGRLLLVAEEVVAGFPAVLLVVKEEVVVVGAPVVLLATFAMFTTAGF